MTRHVLICRLSLLAGILWGTCPPGEIARGGEINMRVSQMTQRDIQPYVAVMGEIRRPGVFELTGPIPQLAEFLRQAGGISPNASGSIRLIRGARSSQFFLSPKLSLQLLPNDLIVVESKASGWQRNAAVMSAAPAPNIVQIGLVNLISRPVILDIPREQAQVNLAQVLSMLHQPVAGNSEVTVIKPGSGLQNIPLEQAFEAILTTGVVLVFDPATVNNSVLPRLPNTIRPGDNADSAVTNTSAESSTAPAIVSATRPASRAEPAGDAVLRVPQVAAPGASDARSPAAMPDALDVSPAARPAEAIQPSITDAQSSDSRSESPDTEPAPDATEEKSSETEPAAAVAPKANSIWSWLAVAGVLTCCIGVGLRLRSTFIPKQVAVPALPQPVASPENALEMLISGSLPIVEEPLLLPYESEIFGRPRETSPYRTDPAQALSGPHYIPQPVPSTTPAVTVVEVLSDEKGQASANAPAERKVRVDMRHPRSTVSVLDRALATFQGEQP